MAPVTLYADFGPHLSEKLDLHPLSFGYGPAYNNANPIPVHYRKNFSFCRTVLFKSLKFWYLRVNSSADAA
jgi:hypothetical protein